MLTKIVALDLAKDAETELAQQFQGWIAEPLQSSHALRSVVSYDHDSPHVLLRSALEISCSATT